MAAHPLHLLSCSQESQPAGACCCFVFLSLPPLQNQILCSSPLMPPAETAWASSAPRVRARPTSTAWPRKASCSSALMPRLPDLSFRTHPFFLEHTLKAPA